MISVSQDEVNTFLNGSQDHRSRAPCEIGMSKALTRDVILAQEENTLLWADFTCHNITRAKAVNLSTPPGVEIRV